MQATKNLLGQRRIYRDIACRLPTACKDIAKETLGYEDNTRIFNVTKTMLNHLLRLSTLKDIPDYQKLVKTSQAEGCNRFPVNDLAVKN
jgi:hypothetical protein